MGSSSDSIDPSPNAPDGISTRGASEGSPVRTASAEGAYYDIVAIASSAGGLHALATVLEALPASFPVPVVVVQHLDPSHQSLMATILSRRTALRVEQSVAGRVPARGTVYVAPPDYHLRVGRSGELEHTQTPLVHYVRPSADVLFKSVAARYGARAIAVILTGAGSDGSAGIVAVKQAGGTTVAEDPDTAQYSAMPYAAVATRCVDYVLSLDAVGPGVLSLVTRGEIA